MPLSPTSGLVSRISTCQIHFRRDHQHRNADIDVTAGAKLATTRPRASWWLPGEGCRQGRQSKLINTVPSADPAAPPLLHGSLPAASKPFSQPILSACADSIPTPRLWPPPRHSWRSPASARTPEPPRARQPATFQATSQPPAIISPPRAARERPA
jgi:hypothetical protein